MIGKAGNRWRIPDTMPFDAAAALMMTDGTSHPTLEDRATLKQAKACSSSAQPVMRVWRHAAWQGDGRSRHGSDIGQGRANPGLFATSRRTASFHAGKGLTPHGAEKGG